MWNFAIANCDLPESFVYAVVDVVMSDNERMVNIHRAARSTLPENWDKNGVLMWHPGAARWFEENAGADIPDDMIHSRCDRRGSGPSPAHDTGPRPRTGRGLIQEGTRHAGGQHHEQKAEETSASEQVIAEGVDEEPIEGNRRLFTGRAYLAIATLATVYAAFHMLALNGVSISDWTGIDCPSCRNSRWRRGTSASSISRAHGAWGFLLFSAHTFHPDREHPETRMLTLLAALLAIPALVAGRHGHRLRANTINSGELARDGRADHLGRLPRHRDLPDRGALVRHPAPDRHFGAIVIGWFERRGRELFAASDIVLALCGIVVAIYLVAIYGTAARNSVGTPFVPIGVAFAATAGSAMILELTRRVAGLALVIITGVFLVYTFTAHLLPGILAVQNAYTWHASSAMSIRMRASWGRRRRSPRPTSSSSSSSRPSCRPPRWATTSSTSPSPRRAARGAAPAKVAIFASGLMGMINGTSAGNVVATGSLTIPLMKKVGYHKKTAGAIEAAASTGGQIMPPIMGAGAFIMAEITGIPYQEIAIAAIIPAILYFASIYFMVDFEAAKLGMRGMREDELPKFKEMARKVFLFLPILILIAALFMGYSVIRAGTLATVAAVVVSWAMPEHFAFRGGGKWSIQRLLVLAIAALSIGLFLLYLLTPGGGTRGDAPASIATLSLIASLVVVVTFLYISYREFAGGRRSGWASRACCARWNWRASCRSRSSRSAPARGSSWGSSR
jgi:TRAP-type uncharacterized transport system fused permease subunit